MNELNRSFRLLQVDDASDEVVLLEYAIRRSGLPVECFSALGGAEAMCHLDSASTELPDTILLDVEMPEISGFDVLDYIRQNRSFSHIPVVMFSSSSDERDVFRARKMGATAYVLKPTCLDATVEFVAALYESWSRCEPLVGWCEFMKNGLSK